MSYVFDVSSEHNDLMEVETFILYEGNGDYRDYNRRDPAGHTIYNVEFRDKRYALQFKLKFNTTLVKWDESDDEQLITPEELLERGYEEMRIMIPYGQAVGFQDWCKGYDIAVVHEIKIFAEMEPFHIYVPAGYQSLVKLTWG